MISRTDPIILNAQGAPHVFLIRIANESYR
jgi:hypothetical protein